MKKIIIFLFLFQITFVNIYGQILTQQQKDSIIASISHNDIWEWGEPLGAILNVEKYQIIEALPIIEENYWKNNDFVQYASLRILQKFKSTKFRVIAHATIDSAEIISKKRRDNIIGVSKLRFQATYYLIKDGDYSTAQYAFDPEARKANPLYYVEALSLILKAMPSYREQCKLALLNVLRTDSSYYDSRNSLDALVEAFGSEIFPDIRWTFENHPGDGRVRMAALDYLITLKYPGLISLLQEKIVSHADTVYSDYYIKVLLTEYGSPSVYSFIKKYQEQQANNFENIYISFIYDDFKPSKPDSLTSLETMIDSLVSFKNQCYFYNWFGDQNFNNELDNFLASARNNYNNGNQIECARQIKQFQQSVDREYRDTINVTPAFVTVEGWKFLYYNAQYILDRLPQIPTEGCNVKLINSTGVKLTGGTLQYYEGGWKDAVNNNDGTFFINTSKTSLSLRMTYEYGTQTKSNVSISSDTIVFRTVNAQIQLQNSNGTLIDTGTVKYYAGAWRDLGTTVNGVASKELLAANYSFRMTYAYASKDKQQDLNTNPTVVFQTVNAAVQLQNSQGALIDQGTVQYYSGAWREFGITSNGVANKELLPNNYSFRMTYAYASNDKKQDLNTNPIVVFQTVNASVQLQNSQGALIDQGTVQYYSGAWREFGTTESGVANKELLPNNYSFRMTYAYASNDKKQDLNTNPIVVFQTVNAKVQLQNSNGVLIDTGTVKYYAGAWRDLGTTINGIASKELLPNNYSFRMTYENASIDKKQDLSTNNLVVFSTVLCTIRVKNAQNEQIDGAMVSYYSGAWRQIGLTVNGEITKELLPLNLSFRVKMGTKQQDKKQDLSTNTVVEFTL